MLWLRFAHFEKQNMEILTFSEILEIFRAFVDSSGSTSGKQCVAISLTAIVHDTTQSCNAWTHIYVYYEYEKKKLNIQPSDHTSAKMKTPVRLLPPHRLLAYSFMYAVLPMFINADEQSSPQFPIGSAIGPEIQ